MFVSMFVMFRSVVIVVPVMFAVAAVFVAPAHFGLEVRAMSMFVAFFEVMRVAPTEAELPGALVRDARVSVRRRNEMKTRPRNENMTHCVSVLRIMNEFSRDADSRKVRRRACDAPKDVLIRARDGLKMIQKWRLTGNSRDVHRGDDVPPRPSDRRQSRARLGLASPGPTRVPRRHVTRSSRTKVVPAVKWVSATAREQRREKMTGRMGKMGMEMEMLGRRRVE